MLRIIITRVDGMRENTTGKESVRYAAADD